MCGSAPNLPCQIKQMIREDFHELFEKIYALQIGRVAMVDIWIHIEMLAGM
jgi:hypothetical protein